MCSRREKTIISYLHRALIALIGASSTMLDGFSIGDLLCWASMLIWLLQPEFSAMEEKALACCKRRLLKPQISD